MTRGIRPNPYRDVVPPLLRLLESDITFESVRALGREIGWAMPEAGPRTLVALEVAGFQWYVVQDDDEFEDHACLSKCAVTREGGFDSDALFELAQGAIGETIGVPLRRGTWPTVPGEDPPFPYRYAIWASGRGLVVLQQDDLEHQRFPELLGRQVDVCLTTDRGATTLPESRLWRSKTFGSR